MNELTLEDILYTLDDYVVYKLNRLIPQSGYLSYFEIELDYREDFKIEIEIADDDDETMYVNIFTPYYDIYEPYQIFTLEELIQEVNKMIIYSHKNDLFLEYNNNVLLNALESIPEEFL